MKYYLIRQPSDKKIIGVADGGVQAEIIESKWKDKKELKRYTNEYILGIYQTLERIEKGEQVEPPKFEYIKLRSKAKVTDFITFSEAYARGGYLISRKVQKILADFNVNCRLYHDIPLYQSDHKIDGYANLHLLPLKAKDVVHFDKTIFFNGLRLADKTLRHAKSYNEYLDLLNEGRMVNIELLSLDDKIGDLDILTFDITSKIYISSRMRAAFEASDITGVDYFEPEEPELLFS
ncbi:MAG: hypothetical protein ACTHLE_01660 [Agriterribacter sp.]